MTPLRAVKISMAIGAVLLILSCGGPTGFVDDRDLSDDGFDRGDFETARADDYARRETQEAAFDGMQTLEAEYQAYMNDARETEDAEYYATHYEGS